MGTREIAKFLGFFSHLWVYNLWGIINVFHCSKCFQDRNDAKNCVMTLLLLLSRVIFSPKQWCVLLLVKCVNSSSRVSTLTVHMLLSLEWIFSCHNYLQIWCFSEHPRGSVCFRLDVIYVHTRCTFNWIDVQLELISIRHLKKTPELSPGCCGIL